MPGELSEVKDADENVKQLVDEVRSSANIESNVFDAVSYRTQTVAGTNYFVKIKVDGEKYIHARIFKPLPQVGSGPQLKSILKDKTFDDQIVSF